MKNIGNEKLGYALVFITGVIWGFIGLFVKLLSNTGSSAALTSFYRMFFSMLFVGIISIIKYGFKSLIIPRKTLFWCAIIGIINQGLYNFVYSKSVELAGVCIASVLLYTSPIFGAITSAIFYKEKIGKNKIIVLFINVVGCIIAVTGLNFNIENLAISGIVFGLLAGFLYGLSPLLGKYANAHKNVFAVIMYNDLFACLFLMLFTKPFNGISSITSIPIIQIVYGALYGILITGVAYMLYYEGVKKITELSRVAVVASIEIVVSAIIGLLVFKEQLGIINFIGIAILIISIALMNSIKA